MKYRRRKTPIEAFQMTFERRMDNSQWPNWLHEAWNKDRREPGALFRSYPSLIAGTPRDTLAIRGRHADTQVGWGDWIVQYGDGGLGTCSPELFEAMYEPVPRETVLDTEPSSGPD